MHGKALQIDKPSALYLSRIAVLLLCLKLVACSSGSGGGAAQGPEDATITETIDEQTDSSWSFQDGLSQDESSGQSAVRAKINQAPKDANAVIVILVYSLNEFGERVYDDGDTAEGGSGEWVEVDYVQGVHQGYVIYVYDHAGQTGLFREVKIAS